MSSFPSFEASQTESDVEVRVQLPDCDHTCRPRIAVDGGNIFGLACDHAYLPLVFADGALCNGTAQAKQEADGSASRTDEDLSVVRHDGYAVVRVRKAQLGRHLDGLKELMPSVFAVASTGDAQHDEEERLAGLEMLQRGIDAMKAGAAQHDEAEPADVAHALPQPPDVPNATKTRIHECFDAKTHSTTARRRMAYDAEQSKWDEGMYLDSYVDQDGEIKHLIQAKLPTAKVPLKSEGLQARAATLDDAAMRRDVQLLALELLLAYAYDRRTTLGEPTVESAWTIGVLCRSLAASSPPSSADGDCVSTVLCGAVRRQLCYGLYRSWTLSLQLAGDVCAMLHDEETCVQQVRWALQQVVLRFEEGDDDVLDIYIRDTLQPLLFWFEAVVDQQSLAEVAEELRSATIGLTKEQVGGQEWELALLEEAAEEAIREGGGQYV